MEDITSTKKNIHIDISNVPTYYLVNVDSFNDYLSKYYKQFFNSENYQYKKIPNIYKKLIYNILKLFKIIIK